MSELLKLSPSFQVKKTRRASIGTFKKKCKGFPQPFDLDHTGIDVPVRFNFAKFVREGNIIDDILQIVSDKLGKKESIIPRVRLNFIKYMGCYVQWGSNNIKVKQGETGSTKVDEILQERLSQLQNEKDVLIGALSFMHYDMSIWNKTEYSNANKIDHHSLTQELRKVKMENKELHLKKEKEWFKAVANDLGVIIPWKTIEVGVSDFSMKRLNGHVTLWSFRKNPKKGGKPYICSIYDSNGNESFNNTYLNRFYKVLFEKSKIVQLYVIRMPYLNTSDNHFIDSNLSILGIQNPVGIKGYCSSLTFLLFLDMICTDDRVYKDGHYERLLNDLQKRSTDEPIQEKHKLASALYGKHISYFLFKTCVEYYKSKNKTPSWWNLVEKELGPWNGFDGLVETVKIKRQLRNGELTYKTTDNLKEFTI